MRILKQVGALPVRRAEDGSLEILLVTSRETGRWVIPKGWPSKRLKDAAAAAREAKEEAGVLGRITPNAIGLYRYRKVELGGARLVDVSVFLLAVEKERRHWPEEGERTRSWFKIAAAARKVREPRLIALIRSMERVLARVPGKPAKKLRARSSKVRRPGTVPAKTTSRQKTARRAG